MADRNDEGALRRFSRALGMPDEHSIKRVVIETHEPRDRSRAKEVEIPGQRPLPEDVERFQRASTQQDGPESGTGGPNETPPVQGRDVQLRNPGGMPAPDDPSGAGRAPFNVPQFSGEEPPVRDGSAGGGGSTGRGGGGGALDTSRRPLQDQRRTAAFDPTLDANDPGNVHATDADGRVNVFAGPAAPASARGPGLPGSSEAGSTPGLSTNNVANDFTPALKSAVSYAHSQFHQTARDEHTDKGYQALVTHNVGAPSGDIMHAVFSVVDPKEELPMNRRMELATKTLHDFYVSKGQPETAAKVAFEVVQFGNKMAKGHGEQAVYALQAGDVGRAVHELQAGYGWLPDGHTAEVHGNNIVMMNQQGDQVGSIPIDPKTVKNLAIGMASGQLGWDVVRSRAEAGGGQPPTAPPTTAQPAAQPPAAAAGPSATPPAAPQGPVQGPTAPPASAIDTTRPAAPQDLMQGPPAPGTATPEGNEVIPFATDDIAPEVAKTRSAVQKLNRQYTKDRLEMTADIKKYGLNPKNPVDLKLIQGFYAGLDKRHADDTREHNDLLKEYERRQSTNEAAERRAIEPKYPGSEAEVERRDAAFAKHAGRYDTATDKDSKIVVQASPLRFLKGDERQPLYDIAKEIQAHNRGMSDQRAIDLTLTAVSHVGETLPTKGDSNGEVGIKGSRWRKIGTDIAKNPVIQLDGERVRLPSRTLKAIEDLKRQSYSEAEKADKAKKEKERQGSVLRTDTTPEWGKSTPEQRDKDPIGSIVKHGAAMAVDRSPARVYYDYNKAVFDRGKQAIDKINKIPPDRMKELLPNPDDPLSR